MESITVPLKTSTSACTGNASRSSDSPPAAQQAEQSWADARLGGQQMDVAWGHWMGQGLGKVGTAKVSKAVMMECVECRVIKRAFRGEG